ncbi:MAG: hypothetical protein V3S69_02925 [Dehalococcoidales bacterium]
MFQRKKTLTAVLASANVIIDDLESIATDAGYEAFDKETEASDLMEQAVEKRQVAAHATIVASRINSLLYVSADDISMKISEKA